MEYLVLVLTIFVTVLPVAALTTAVLFLLASGFEKLRGQ